MAQEMSFKDVSYLRLLRPSCSACAIVVDGSMRYISVKIVLIRTSGSGDVV